MTDTVFTKRSTLVSESSLTCPSVRPCHLAHGSIWRPERHGNICNQGHWVHFRGQIWPPRLLSGLRADSLKTWNLNKQPGIPPGREAKPRLGPQLFYFQGVQKDDIRLWCSKLMRKRLCDIKVTQPCTLIYGAIGPCLGLNLSLWPMSN